jgi:hypothetical protein
MYVALYLSLLERHFYQWVASLQASERQGGGRSSSHIKSVVAFFWVVQLALPLRQAGRQAGRMRHAAFPASSFLCMDWRRLLAEVI